MVVLKQVLLVDLGRLWVLLRWLRQGQVPPGVNKVVCQVIILGVEVKVFVIVTLVVSVGTVVVIVRAVVVELDVVVTVLVVGLVIVTVVMGVVEEGVVVLVFVRAYFSIGPDSTKGLNYEANCTDFEKGILSVAE